MPQAEHPHRVTHRVSWTQGGDVVACDVIEAPSVQEGVLVVKPEPGSVLWVPLVLLSGPVTVEALP